MNWLSEALCAQVDTEIFFPKQGQSSARAKSICSTCPVAVECLRYALDTRQQEGIWGGLSPRERQSLRRHKKPINHGTMSGCQTHYRRGEPPCDPCREAAAEYNRRHRAKVS